MPDSARASECEFVSVRGLWVITKLAEQPMFMKWVVWEYTLGSINGGDA
jgi:hypothetical protein